MKFSFSKNKCSNSITNVMKKCFCILLSLILTGCSLEDISGIQSDTPAPAPQETETTTTDQISVYGTDGLEITTSESVIDMMEEEDDSTSTLSAADLISANDRLFNDGTSDYAFSMIDPKEQEIYKEIYVILTEFEEDVVLSTTDTDMISHAFRCVLVDHPEIFYVSGYSISKYMAGDTIKKIAFKGTYTMDKDTADSKRVIIDDYVDKCLSGISQSASDYEKVKYVYTYLIDDNTYDLESENNQNILSVCENQVTVCQGYAKMTQLLLNKLGVFCILVNGTALNAIQIDEDGVLYESDEKDWGAHVWNIVKADGNYYNVDTTWGDASFLYNDADGSSVDGPSINFDYLMVPDRMLTDTHRPNPVVDMPVCDNMDDFYFVREGLYFTQVDDGQLGNAFDAGYAQGEQYVTIKCSDESVYSEMRKHLFEKEKVFDYLSGTSVKYVEYPDRFAITIYL